MNDHKTSSSIATGQAGAFFEQHVGAYFLSLLAVKAIAPVVADSVLDAVHFQTGHLGWSTDDLLLVAADKTGLKHNIAAQVKRQFLISASNQESKKTIAGFWQDFKHNSGFNADTDRLLLIVMKGTKALLHDLSNLLDCARVSTSYEDFTQRVQTDGFLSDQSKRALLTIDSIVTEIEKDKYDPEDIHGFLSVLHVHSLDLNSSSSTHEAQAKSLLSMASVSADSHADANSTWSELLNLVGGESTGMPSAASYKFLDLPDDIRNRHNNTADSGFLKSLDEHSQITVNGIRTTIGDQIDLPRKKKVFESLNALNGCRILLLSGAAGAGKSAIAKFLYQQLRRESSCVVFRAEELTTGHIDNTITNAGISSTAKNLLDVLSTRGRTTVFIESVERLLEAPHREGFTDLLREINTRENIELVLTCRDYSLLTVQSAFFDSASTKYKVVAVGPLTDGELSFVAKRHAAFENALTLTKIRNLLRIPYFLNIAAYMDWDAPVDEAVFDERAFRRKCWSEVIRNDAHIKDGMHRRREAAFVDISVRRAKALQAFVELGEFEQDVIQSLINDELLTESATDSNKVAPSHDVLEDWATQHWIQNLYSANRSTTNLELQIGRYPALRRGFRVWLTELLDYDASQATDLVLDAFRSSDLPDYFRDDVIVSVLTCSSAEAFLNDNMPFLLKDNARQLTRVIHLLRVACKTTPKWLKPVAHVPSVLLQPEGRAWESVLKICSNNLSLLVDRHLPLVIGLIKDWSGSVHWQRQNPPGSNYAGHIAFSLLDRVQISGSSEQIEQIVDVILKISNTYPDKMQALFQRAYQLDREDRIARHFSKALITNIGSTFCVKHFPDEVMQLMNIAYLMTEEDVQQALDRKYDYPSTTDVDEHFGIRDHVFDDYTVQSSAMRWPFSSLLRYHPKKALNYIIKLANHASEWYGSPKWPFERLEQPEKIQIQYQDGTVVEQWCSERLWSAYRGMHVSPDLLQCALMALEEWFLMICKMDKVDCEFWFLHALRNSNNVGITAVVASACIAYPDKAGTAGLALLGSRRLIQMDRSRMAGESSISGMFGVFPGLGYENKLFNDERKQSAALPHRQFDLEHLAICMQMGEHKEAIWKQIDDFRDVLPKQDDQTYGDQLWRLALHRMDVRGFKPVDQPNHDVNGDPERVYLEPGNIEPDLQEIIDGHAQKLALQSRVATLHSWGYRVWHGETDRTDAEESWKEKLQLALANPNDEEEDYLNGGHGYVASVCIRDFWDKLSKEEQDWCCNQVCFELKQHRDSTDDVYVVGNNSMRGDRPAAAVVSKALASIKKSDPNYKGFFHALVDAVTHSCEEVREFAVAGVGRYLFQVDPDLSIQIIAAMFKESILLDEVWAPTKLNYAPYQRNEYQLKARAVTKRVRRLLLRRDIDSTSTLSDMGFENERHRQSIIHALAILSFNTEQPFSLDFHKKCAQFLEKAWSPERIRKNRRVSFSLEKSCKDSLAKFVNFTELSLAIDYCKIIANHCESSPEKVADFLESLMIKEDEATGPTNFWHVWKVYASKTLACSWIDDLDYEHLEGRKLVSKLFLSTQWKENLRSWARLEYASNEIDEFYLSLPKSDFAIECYVKFLHDIGEKFLPEGYKHLANRIERGTKLNANSIWYLEKLLSREIFSNPRNLKKDPDVQDAIIYILDYLVNQGSSSAYRMRDDFVTPLAVGHLSV